MFSVAYLVSRTSYRETKEGAMRTANPVFWGVVLIFLLSSRAVLAQTDPLVNQTGSPQPAATAFDALVPVPGGGQPLAITVGEPRQPLPERLKQKITLDVRDMSVVDVLRFLALKGEFNLVTAGVIQGRATFYLKSVSIKDALDIAVLSNKLSYHIENEIVRVMTEQEFEAMFGKSFSDKREVSIVHLKYAKPSYALSALEGMKSAIGQIIVDEDTGNVVLIDTAVTLEKMKNALQDIETPLEVVVYPLQYAKADVVAEKLRARVDAQAVGSLSVDERSNQIIVRAFPGRKDEISGILKTLDVPTKEVLVEARVVQVVFKPEQDYGIDWNVDFRNSPYQALRRVDFNNIFLDEKKLAGSDNLFSKYSRIAIGNFDVNKFQLAIRALRQVSDTKILSNPKILVTNGQEAKIHIGDTVPYIISTTSGTGDNAITSEDVRFVDVGLKLNVTPTINDEGFVTMALKPEISTVTGQIQSKGGGIPQVNKTLVETTVIVKNGMTIILGGLKKENKVLSRKGLPVLMDMPYLRRLFSSQKETVESTEIVIFITPHIVSGDEHYNEYRGSIKPPKEYEKSDSSLMPEQPANAEMMIKP